LSPNNKKFDPYAIIDISLAYSTKENGMEIKERIKLTRTITTHAMQSDWYFKSWERQDYIDGPTNKNIKKDKKKYNENQNILKSFQYWGKSNDNDNYLDDIDEQFHDGDDGYDQNEDAEQHEDWNDDDIHQDERSNNSTNADEIIEEREWKPIGQLMHCIIKEMALDLQNGITFIKMAKFLAYINNSQICSTRNHPHEACFFRCLEKATRFRYRILRKMIHKREKRNKQQNRTPPYDNEVDTLLEAEYSEAMLLASYSKFRYQQKEKLEQQQIQSSITINPKRQKIIKDTNTTTQI
jgi:hypothetical protein